MIAISSHRPLADSVEYMRTQLLAHESWEEVFSQIVYFGEPQLALDSDKTVFIVSEEYPRILDLVEFAAAQNDWCCLINADIVVAPHLPAIEQNLKRQRVMAAISQRWQFDMDDEKVKPKVVDLGLDFFAASPIIWREAFLCIPPEFRIGHIRWDTWMLGFFNHRCGSGCRDLTKAQVIFHPRHGDRRMPHHIPDNIDDHYARHAVLPARHMDYAATI